MNLRKQKNYYKGKKRIFAYEGTDILAQKDKKVQMATVEANKIRWYNL